MVNEAVNKLDTEERKIRTEFLNANTHRVASEQTYTTSPKMMKNSIAHLVMKTRDVVTRDKFHGQGVINKLGLN